MHRVSSIGTYLIAFGLLLAGASLPVFSSTDLTAGSTEEAGEKIAVAARESEKGFGNFTATMTMTLRNKKGQESRRELRIKVIEVEDDGDRTLFVFDNPKDVKGTAFLIHAFKHKADQQWLYLPALKRVKGISSKNQSGSFMGSEFSYEDLGAVEVEKFSHQYLGDEPCGELQCYVLERVPNAKNSGYSRQVLWIDHEALRTHKIDYYDRRDELLKTMTVEGYKLYLDRVWKAETISMENHLTSKGTVLVWSDYEFATGLDLGDFTKTALKRVR